MLAPVPLRPRPWWNAALAVAVVVLGLRTAWSIARLAVASPRLPFWDEAKYGLSGLRLADSLDRLDLWGWLATVYTMDDAPPLFALVESLAFLLFGEGYGVPRGLMALIFAALVSGTWWTGRQISPESPAVAAVGAGAVLVSPMVHALGGIVMLELPGALLLVLALGAYARWLSNGRAGAWRATCLLSLMLFFCKYNYAMLWLAALALHEGSRAAGSLPALWTAAVRRLRQVELQRPWPLFVVLYLGVLFAVVASGGLRFSALGRSISVGSPGNPLYLLCWIALVRSLLRGGIGRFRAWRRALPGAARSFLDLVALPAATWLMLPPHLKNFLDFVRNRSSGISLWSLENLLFYPRVFVHDYHPTPSLGLALLALALAGAWRLWRGSPAERSLAATGLCVLLVALHPYKQPRFLLVVTPLLWLMAGAGLAAVIELVARSPRARAFANAGVALAAVVAVTLTPAVSPRLDLLFAERTVSEEVRALADEVSDRVARQPDATTLVLGTWNGFSPGLLEWHGRQRHPGSVPARTIVPSTDGDATAGLLSSLGPGSGAAPQRLLIVDALPDAEGAWVTAYRAETSWLEPVRRGLEQGRLPYAPVDEVMFREAGFRLQEHRRGEAP